MNEGDQSLWQWITGGLVAALAAIGGWVSARLHGRVDEVGEELKNHKLFVAENYVRNPDMRERISDALEPIKEGQQRMEEKLDRLLDREREQHKRGA